MYFLRTALVQKFRRLSQLRTADNGIINEQQALILDQVMYRD